MALDLGDFLLGMRVDQVKEANKAEDAKEAAGAEPKSVSINFSTFIGGTGVTAFFDGTACPSKGKGRVTSGEWRERPCKASGGGV